MPPKEKLTIQLMQEIARSRGGECLSTEYGNWDTTLLWRCAQGHVWENRAGKIKSGQWCPTCAGKSPKGLEYLRELAAKNNGQCLSTVYPGMQNLASWRCAQGHEWQAKPNNVRHGTWCPYCRGMNQTLEDLQLLARGRGGECLSQEYHGQAKKYEWRCSDNHVWKATANSLKNGSWCPFCRVNYGEEICRIYFEASFGKPFPKSRPPFLYTGPRGNLELDGYCEELQLAFEHHGLQHYRRVRRFQPTEQDFIEQQQRDAAKLAACHAARVTVVEIPAIPELTTIDALPALVKTQLARFGITAPFDPPIASLDFSKAYDRSALDELRRIANDRAGELLSDVYLGDRGQLRWRCSAGHEWMAAPNSIKSGSWCAQCYGNVRKTLNEIREKAISRGYILISDEYRGANVKHRWKCREGHEWEAIPRKILNEGTGCPRCAGQDKTIDDIRALAKERGVHCLSTEYAGQHGHLKWECAQGHQFEMTPRYAYDREGDLCPVCRDEKRRAERVEVRMAALRKAVAAKGGEVVNGDYREPHSKFTYRCMHGHEWTTSYDSIMQGTWCPECYRASRHRPPS